MLVFPLLIWVVNAAEKTVKSSNNQKITKPMQLEGIMPTYIHTLVIKEMRGNSWEVVKNITFSLSSTSSEGLCA